MVFGTMKRTYSIVSIDGNTGTKLHEFLATHKEQYPSVISFVDAAVNEKLLNEELKDIPKIEQNNSQIDMNGPLNGGGL